MLSERRRFGFTSTGTPVVAAADAARLHLEARLHVVERLLNTFSGSSPVRSLMMSKLL